MRCSCGQTRHRCLRLRSVVARTSGASGGSMSRAVAAPPLLASTAPCCCPNWAAPPKPLSRSNGSATAGVYRRPCGTSRARHPAMRRTHRLASPVLRLLLSPCASSPGRWATVCTPRCGAPFHRRPLTGARHNMRALRAAKRYFTFYVDLEDLRRRHEARAPARLGPSTPSSLSPSTHWPSRASLLASGGYTSASGRGFGHELHYDVEERTMERSGRVLHPAVSSVVYLSDGGDPTIVLDETLDAP